LNPKGTSHTHFDSEWENESFVQQISPHRKKIASVGAANQVFVVLAKYTGTAPTASVLGKLAARTVTQIKVLVCLNHCISLGVFLYKI
jgi:hypothetical protein